jgi:hypothetical protein
MSSAASTPVSRSIIHCSAETDEIGDDSDPHFPPPLLIARLLHSSQPLKRMILYRNPSFSMARYSTKRERTLELSATAQKFWIIWMLANSSEREDIPVSGYLYIKGTRRLR